MVLDYSMMKNTTTTEHNVVTNDLKKGDLVQLENGWMARIADNRKGDTRLCTVYGFETEMGSVYSHHIIQLVDEVAGTRTPITHTEKQKAVKHWADALWSSRSGVTAN
jgi:hypothetical protein